MKGFILSTAAQRDLDDIWEFSAARWSAAQANEYVGFIRAACENLASGRAKGRSIDAVRSGYWQYMVKSHILFYRIAGSDIIDIVRILHQRMDVESHL